MGINKHTAELIGKIVRHHNLSGSSLTYGVQNMHGNYPDQYVFLKSLGFSDVESLDVYDKEKPTYVADLTKDVTKTIVKKYDLILDGGTMEHCFDPVSVLRNTVSLAKVGGVVIHINPMNNWVNHSFYQFSPTLYYDFYYDNGFDSMCSWVYIREGLNVGKIERIKRNGKHGGGKPLLIVFTARKTQDVGEIAYPIQEKYLKSRNWGEKLCDI